MKPKQLANVLIKILGLSVCVHAVTAFVSSFLVSLNAFQVSRVDYVLIRTFTLAVAAAIEAGIGLALIFLSQKIADVLLKHDDE